MHQILKIFYSIKIPNIIISIGWFILLIIPFNESPENYYGLLFLLLGTILISLPIFKTKIRFDNLDYILIGFLIFYGISTIFSWSFSKSFPEFIKYIAYFVIFVSIRRLSNIGKNNIQKLIISGFIIYVLYYGFFTLKYIFFKPVNIGAHSLNFFYAYAGHNHLAGLLLFAIPLSCGLFIAFKNLGKNIPKNIAGIIIILELVLLFFCFSRSAYILIFFYFLTFVISNSEIFKSKWIYFFIPVFLGIFVLFQFIFLYSLSDKNPLKLNKYFYKRISNPELRIEYFKQALQGIKTSPFIGTGPDTFLYVSNRFQSSSYDYYTVTNPHNYFLKIFTETGLFAGILFIVFFLYSGFKFIKNKNKNDSPLKFSFFSAVILTLLNNLVDYDTDFICIPMFIFILLGLISHVKNEAGIKNNFKFNYLFGMFDIMFIYVFVTLISGNFILDNAKNLKLFESKEKLYFSGLIIPWSAIYQEKISFLSENNNQYTDSEYFNSKARLLDQYDMSIKFHGAAIKERLDKYGEAREIYLQIIRQMPQYYGTYRSYFRTFLLQAKYDLKNQNYESALLNLRKSEVLSGKLDKISGDLDAVTHDKNYGSMADLLYPRIDNSILNILQISLENEEIRGLKAKIIY